jgi:hypothetical protein
MRAVYVRMIRTPAFAEVPGSNLCHDSGSLESGFRDFNQSLQANAGMVTKVAHFVQFLSDLDS